MTNSVRMSSEVKNPPDYDQVLIKRVVYGIRESLGQETVVTENLLMDACVKQEGINVREQGIKEVLAQSFALLLIEETTGMQVFDGRGKDLDSHSKRFLSSRFAVGQSTMCS